MQVAGSQLCPLGSPSVAPQEQVLGEVQVAFEKICLCTVVGSAVVSGALVVICSVVAISVVGAMVSFTAVEDSFAVVEAAIKSDVTASDDVMVTTAVVF